MKRIHSLVVITPLIAHGTFNCSKNQSPFLMYICLYWNLLYQERLLYYKRKMNEKKDKEDFGTKKPEEIKETKINYYYVTNKLELFLQLLKENLCILTCGNKKTD